MDGPASIPVEDCAINNKDLWCCHLHDISQAIFVCFPIWYMRPFSSFVKRIFLLWPECVVALVVVASPGRRSSGSPVKNHKPEKTEPWKNPYLSQTNPLPVCCMCMYIDALIFLRNRKKKSNCVYKIWFSVELYICIIFWGFSPSSVQLTCHNFATSHVLCCNCNSCISCHIFTLVFIHVACFFFFSLCLANTLLVSCQQSSLWE